ncbi:MAG: hypothetical protein CMG09_03460 [Candidatus Marinimicrobia bacterium]|nr:hypothetical protein [Candidatus Neomarinimicrobiota bacterium]
MKYLLFILCLFVFSCDSYKPESAPTVEQQETMKKKLSDFNDCNSSDGCRWYNDKYEDMPLYDYDLETGTIILTIVAQPMANNLAINAYVRTLKEMHKDIAVEQNLKIKVWQADWQGKAKIVEEYEVKGEKL